MEYRVLQHRGRIAHGRKTKHVNEIPDLERRGLLREHAESLALTLKKKSIAQLLVPDNASNPNAVARSLGRRKPQQLRQRNFFCRGLNSNKAQSRHVEQNSRQLAVRVVEASTYAFDEDFAV